MQQLMSQCLYYHCFILLIYLIFNLLQQNNHCCSLHRLTFYKGFWRYYHIYLMTSASFQHLHLLRELVQSKKNIQASRSICYCQPINNFITKPILIFINMIFRNSIIEFRLNVVEIHLIWERIIWPEVYF